MNTAHHDAAIYHAATIQDQFTRQAEPFAERHGGSKDALLETMAACGGFSAEDTLLDVACGPGIVSCYFAPQRRWQPRRPQHCAKTAGGSSI